MGYVAKQNFSCCNSCAGYDISVKVAENAGKVRKGAKQDVRGCVFYHRQATESMNTGGTLYLSYGQLGTTKGDFGLPTAEGGKEIATVLKKHGLKVEWNGDENVKIKVDMTFRLPPKGSQLSLL